MARIPVVLFAFALSVSACGGDGDAASDDATTSTTSTTTTSTTTTTTTTTEAPPASTTEAPLELVAADLAATGPYPVGVVTRELPTGNLVDVWYPAGPDAEGQTDSYQVRSFVPEFIASLVPAEIPDTNTVAAARNTEPAEDGPFPVVLFSHGSAGFRYQSTTLMHHLASWGFVVASADHPSRSLYNVLSADQEGQPRSADDMRAVRKLIDDDADPVLAGIVDTTQIALAGHSAGGGTILEVARDEGVVGYISYASTAGETASLPDVPSLFMAGALDTHVEVDLTRAAFELAPSPSWYWELAGAGHLVFSDLCAVGDDDLTIIDLAEAAGVGAFVTDDLRSLGSDGCEEPNLPVKTVWPSIHLASTAFFRWVFGIDAEPLGLDGADATSGTVTDTK